MISDEILVIDPAQQNNLLLISPKPHITGLSTSPGSTRGNASHTQTTFVRAVTIDCCKSGYNPCSPNSVHSTPKSRSMLETAYILLLLISKKGEGEAQKFSCE